MPRASETEVLCACEESCGLKTKLALFEIALRDIAEFCSGDNSPLRAIERVAQVRDIANGVLSFKSPEKT